jgi:hypothetical protein
MPSRGNYVPSIPPPRSWPWLWVSVTGSPATDAVRIATAVQVGADRFLTNNERDFPRTITEVAITHPRDLADPSAV